MTARKVAKSRRHVASVLIIGLLSAGLIASLVSPVAHSKGAMVNIVNKAFSPDTITVIIGVNNTVTWTNSDPLTHTVTANDNSWNSGSLASGATYTHTFTTPGTFDYHCTIHTFMMGTVIVLGTGTSTSASSTTSSSTSQITTSQNPTTSTTPTTAVTPTTTVTATPVTSAQSSSTASGGIPEFPFGAVAVGVITVLVLASYVLARQRMRPRGPGPRSSL